MEFNFLTWNIGYGGLGKEMDFFYDGGKQVRPTEEKHLEYFKGIQNLIKVSGAADFIFLQEVDIHSKRSWYVDELKKLRDTLPDFSDLFLPNYDCWFVPVPTLHPMGRVLSGIVSFSRIKPNGTDTQYFDQFFPWPKRLFYLKYGYLLSRFKLDNGKDLVLVNVHNSAYERAQASRKKELALLGALFEKEYALGNYVVAGGDWNCNPRGFDASSITSGDKVFLFDRIESDFLPDWQFVFDKGKSSNRNMDMPYQKGITETTIFDFFVVSPNIAVLKVETNNMNFKYSDHNPVVMKIRLK